MSANGKKRGLDQREFHRYVVQTTESIGSLRTRLAVLESWLPEVREDIRAIRTCLGRLEKSSSMKRGNGWIYEVIRVLAALLAGLTGGRLGGN